MPITTTIAFVGKDDDDDDNDDVETDGDDKMIKSYPSRPLLRIFPSNLYIHTQQKVLRNQFCTHANSFFLYNNAFLFSILENKKTCIIAI